ncbi:MAG: nucleotidyltransferase family protein [Candidatus Brocadiales bacterium]|uniref:nucleotidyltransferase family protein n=1 Tax=Candidatus Avalokitesvara rifleensis TaxID=3367620 RepID=UPI002712FBEF|nr:nucleotidyltransferase family protein [Candidatus Brocadiales bacterium]
MKTVKTMLSVREINKILKGHKEELYRKYKVKEIGVFGSFVRGGQKRRSDIDILVEFEEVPDLLKFIELERRLSRILKRKVDLVEKTSIRPRLKDIILSEVVYV